MRNVRWISILAMTLVVGMAFSAYAGTQSVTFSPKNLTIIPGDSGKLALVYDVPEGDKLTTGIGVRIFFNSKVFQSISFDDIYGVGLVSNDETAQDDVDDLDNDLMTDKYVGIAWVSVMGNWPNLVELPVDLATLVLTPHAEMPVRPVTSINVKAIDTAKGYGFSGDSAEITIP